jgi:hypothetical protein
MKTYRIEFASGPFSTVVAVVVITALCLSLIGLPLAVVMIPTMYRIVEVC